MDAVITYVNCTDPVWQKQYADFTQQPVEPERYRDWGFLPYLFRGIDKYMPFVDRVFLVVSTRSQVPEWVNDKVRIVLHEDFMPKRFLPTFNSTAIETYLYRIPGLGEEFLYFNDDLFPLMPLQKEDFFEDGKAIMHFRLRNTLFHMNVVKSQRRFSDNLARKAAGLKPQCKFLYHSPLHTVNPMLRSTQQEAFERVGDEIERGVTQIRSADQINQFFYLYYLRYTGRTVDRRPSFVYCAMGKAPTERIVDHILNPTRKIVCINDVPQTNGKEDEIQRALKAAFEQHFPTKSRFEK